MNREENFGPHECGWPSVRTEMPTLNRILDINWPWLIKLTAPINRWTLSNKGRATDQQWIASFCEETFLSSFQFHLPFNSNTRTNIHLTPPNVATSYEIDLPNVWFMCARWPNKRAPQQRAGDHDEKKGGDDAGSVRKKYLIIHDVQKLIKYFAEGISVLTFQFCWE